MRAMLLLSVLLGGISALPSLGAVLHVPGDYLTIQAAVDAAHTSGDSILIAAGVFSEDVQVLSKSITILGAGSDSTFVQSFDWSNVAISEYVHYILGNVHVTGSLSAGAHCYHLDINDCVIDGASTFTASMLGGVGAQSSVFHGPLACDGSVYDSNAFQADDCAFNAFVAVSCDYVTIENSHLFNGADIDAHAYYAIVSNCSLEGGGYVHCYWPRYVAITDNDLDGGWIAVEGTEWEAVVVEVARNVAVGGIDVYGRGDSVTIAANVLSDGNGVLIDAMLNPIAATVTQNVIHGCLNGIRVLLGNDESDTVAIVNNTVFGCAVAGIRIYTDDVSAVVIEKNLVVGNAQGMVFQIAPDAEQVLCNDVYDNPDGNWVGGDFAGMNGNFALDPLFCAADNGDFRLAANSPCLPSNGSCGLVGALGEGCSELGACCHGDGTCMVATEADCGAIGVWLGAERACDPNPCLTGACCLNSFCAWMVEADCVSYGGTYEGNATLCEPNPCPTSGVEDAVGSLPLAIRATPNPSTGAIMIEFALPRASSVTIEVFDAAGRLVRKMDKGEQVGGAHGIAWDGRDDNGREMPTGVYFTRIVTAQGSAMGRAVIAR